MAAHATYMIHRMVCHVDVSIRKWRVQDMCFSTSHQKMYRNIMCMCGLVEVSSLPGSDTVSVGVATDICDTVSVGVATDISNDKDDWNFRDWIVYSYILGNDLTLVLSLIFTWTLSIVTIQHPTFGIQLFPSPGKYTLEESNSCFQNVVVCYIVTKEKVQVNIGDKLSPVLLDHWRLEHHFPC